MDRRALLQVGSALTTAAAAVALAFGTSAFAQTRTTPGVSDTEIRIGNIVPYSGPASAYGTIGKAGKAYFDFVNANGGIGGKKVVFVSVDDAYNPSKTVEQTRKLVEQDDVLLIFGSLGTAHNMAIQKYLNAKKVPQLFVATGATRFGDPKAFPWTMGWQPTYQAESQIYAQHILKNNPNAKIAVLSQNDDMGRDYLKGFLDGLGEKAKTMVVAQATYEVTDPTIDSQMVKLKSSGADTFYSITTPKFAAMSIKKAGELGWDATRYLASVSQSVAAVLKPAGFEHAKGVISATYLRDPTEPRWKGTKELSDYLAVMSKYYPDADINDSLNVLGYSSAQSLEKVLRAAGNDLSRENVMKTAASLSFELPMLYPGIEVKTGPNDFFPIEKMQPQRFNGTSYEPLGSVIGQ